MFLDLLRIRASSTLFRLRSADDIKARLHFHNTGAAQEPTLIVGQLNGEGYPGANFRSLLYVINVDKTAHQLDIPAARGHGYVLHPVHLAADAADSRPAQLARFDGDAGVFNIPARSAVVFVELGQ
jgi:outer membrane translocation and assembly module TamA